MKISGVYEIVNTVNGHRYIGSSADIAKRWNEHKRDLERGVHHSLYLQRAWNKYGRGNFTFRIIEYCEKLSLIEHEQFYFDTLKPAYNNSPTARSPLGVKHSAATRRKVSEAGKGRCFSELHRQRIGIALKGRTFSDETKAKIGEKSKGRIFSAESREKMSKSQSARKHRSGYSPSDEARHKISAALIGNKNCIGRIPWNKGKKGVQTASIDTRKKMSQSRTGRKHSEETRRKQSEARKKYWEERRHANERSV